MGVCPTCQAHGHTQHSEDAQGTTPCLSEFALGVVVKDVCVWEDLYPALLSVNAAEHFKGGFPALIMAPQPSRTLAIRWDSLGQP